MMCRSKMKWLALLVLIMSVAFLLVHLSIAKSSVRLVQYSARAGLSDEFAGMPGTRIPRNKRLWGPVKPLESLQPYANPRGSFPVPNERYGHFIYAKVFGGFEKIRPSICDLVAISRLLNATLVIPEIQQSTRSKGISDKFKSFSYLYNEEQFINYLKNDVTVVKSLPAHLRAARRRNEFPTFKPTSSASPNYYIKEVLPKLKNAKVIGLVLADGGGLQSILPRNMDELQRLRCRVAFHALQFRPEIQALGRRMVERLRAWGRPYLAFHPGLVRETLAYHGCAELFQDVHTELIQYRRAQMIKKGIINEELGIDSRVQKRKGLCPLMPEEVGIILRGMGYPPKTIIYLAGSEIFGGQRILIPLRAMFPNLVDRTSLCSTEELAELIGLESPLAEDAFQFPPRKSEKELKEEWQKAGPRPRPLPPPPDRPIYQHEKEGWYGWIGERDREPDPSPFNLRMEAHRLLWDALDFIVSVEADAFFPGFHNDGSGWPDFSSLVMGQRLYESASSRTYRPDRKALVEYLNSTYDSMYVLRRNWTHLVQEHLNKSLEIEGLVRQSQFSKPTSFLSHPLPECSCRIGRPEAMDLVKGKDGHVHFGGEDVCPTWMGHGQDVVLDSKVTKDENDDESGWEEYESNLAEQAEFGKNSRNTNFTLPFDQDEEMDPND
ncbi:hypothetical protein CDL15_Pgr001321 [Punica granatum]|uniref:O-fucosyltransferase family protein n=1 Tax=Punica granatum TaxID=22663 RepID=A0A218WK47_PUNGR|nr:hypothetical protein CDL15_Pgr001321 [Punica granatum]